MFNSERPTIYVVSIENSKTESVLNEIFGVIVFTPFPFQRINSGIPDEICNIKCTVVLSTTLIFKVKSLDEKLRFNVLS